jgi:hypothetical protein
MPGETSMSVVGSNLGNLLFDLVALSLISNQSHFEGACIHRIFIMNVELRTEDITALTVVFPIPGAPRIAKSRRGVG